MPKYWMITDRNVADGGLGTKQDGLTYWTADDGDITNFSQWTKVSATKFRSLLIDSADKFPLITDPNEFCQQKHVTLFVHGYNATWDSAAQLYQTLCQQLFAGDQSMGECVLYTWPSKGSPAEYLPDRSTAVAAAQDLADVLCMLYDWLSKQQLAAMKGPDKACRAQTSIIAHSMGNYLLQNAMQSAWTRQNRPLMMSLVSQLLMVAADVDNDLFRMGNTVDGSDGDAIANLCYRISALYSGLDAVLGASASLKHFGKRRLGRSGLDDTVPVPDNVCQFDCTEKLGDGLTSVHSAYFHTAATIELMRGILRGTDRKVLARQTGIPSRAKE